MRALLSSLIAATILAGCGMSAKNLHRANTTAQQKTADVEYCKVYGEAKGGTMSSRGRRDANFKLCMLDRGYREGASQ